MKAVLNLIVANLQIWGLRRVVHLMFSPLELSASQFHSKVVIKSLLQPCPCGWGGILGQSGRPVQLKSEATPFPSLILALISITTPLFARELLPGTVCSGFRGHCLIFPESQIEKSNLNTQENILMNIF